MHTSSIVLRGLAVAAALLFAGTASAQRVDANRIVELTLEVEGQMMSGMVPEGRSFRLVLRETDQFELVPVIAPADPRRVILAVYRGVADQAATRRMVERREISIGEPVTLRSHPGIRVVVDGVRMRGGATQTSGGRAAIPARPALFTAQSDQCCVCCGEACACACGVKMDCGYCCMGDCCGVMQQPTADHDALQFLTHSRRFAAFSRGDCVQGSIFERVRTPRSADARIALR